VKHLRPASRQRTARRPVRSDPCPRGQGPSGGDAEGQSPPATRPNGSTASNSTSRADRTAPRPTKTNIITLTLIGLAAGHRRRRADRPRSSSANPPIFGGRRYHRDSRRPMDQRCLLPFTQRSGCPTVRSGGRACGDRNWPEEVDGEEADVPLGGCDQSKKRPKKNGGTSAPRARYLAARKAMDARLKPAVMTIRHDLGAPPSLNPISFPEMFPGPPPASA